MVKSKDLEAICERARAQGWFRQSEYYSSQSLRLCFAGLKMELMTFSRDRASFYRDFVRLDTSWGNQGRCLLKAARLRFPNDHWKNVEELKLGDFVLPASPLAELGAVAEAQVGEEHLVRHEHERLGLLKLFSSRGLQVQKSFEEVSLKRHAWEEPFVAESYKETPPEIPFWWLRDGFPTRGLWLHLSRLAAYTCHCLVNRTTFEEVVKRAESLGAEFSPQLNGSWSFFPANFDPEKDKAVSITQVREEDGHFLLERWNRESCFEIFDGRIRLHKGHGRTPTYSRLDECLLMDEPQSLRALVRLTGDRNTQFEMGVPLQTRTETLRVPVWS